MWNPKRYNLCNFTSSSKSDFYILPCNTTLRMEINIVHLDTNSQFSLSQRAIANTKCSTDICEKRLACLKE